MSRGKEYKGQTLVIDGSKSGASVVITRLSYDPAFNLEFVGEARYGSKESDLYWYIEKLLYDSAFNLTSIQTAQNKRLLGNTGVLTIIDDDVEVPSGVFISDLNVGDSYLEDNSTDTETLVSNLVITAITGDRITLNNTPIQTDPSKITISLENYIAKDFNKRAWTVRTLYTYE